MGGGLVIVHRMPAARPILTWSDATRRCVIIVDVIVVVVETAAGGVVGGDVCGGVGGGDGGDVGGHCGFHRFEVSSILTSLFTAPLRTLAFRA